ncbi:metallopeptidase family M24-domain-containing protein [Parachaetomium inaequale]|uniref:Xaa-Pro aminopeptidase n=1 Tax=Parachaetomium inaequale TaxID=2588326 RepID=A0AAN6PMW1_9PEZI|nr:metallopeptidase family M24-domain-containing protein [Parachaetomium inaequale]
MAWLEADLGKFPAKTHARKVAKELGVKDGIIYLPGQKEEFYEDSDMGPKFRQRRHFYYITGADFPGCAVTYDIGRDHLILWIPRIEPRTVLWYGRTPSIEQCKAASEVDDVRYIDSLLGALCPVLGEGTTLYVLHPDQVPRIEHATMKLRIDTTSLRPAMDNARVIKTAHEIALIRRANAVSSGAHKTVLTNLRRLTTERAIDAVFTGYCTAHGAPTQAYPLIAASGPNASTLHYTDNNQPLHGRQLLVLDGGAEWHCYASDVTRTLPLPLSVSGGTFPSREAGAIYRAVERMQEECIARVRPGVAFYALHLHACAVAAHELLRLGVLRGGSVAEIMARGTVAAFFPHGLGHHVGLEVHDVSGSRGRLLLGAAAAAGPRPVVMGPAGGRVRTKAEWVGPRMVAALYGDAVAAMRDLSYDENGRVESGGRQKLEENMVVTIEPGIYFCREYIEGYFLNDPVHSKYINKEELDKYWDVGGVRIEDDILVTKDGYENLTWAPKGDAMLRILKGEPSEADDM